MGRESRGIVESARKSVAAGLHCEPERVFFTSGGTEANNAIIKGVFQASGGGHIITSLIEHESVLGACSQVEMAGGSVTYLPAGLDGRVSTEAVRQAVRPDTILISIMHANNETGAIQPIQEIVSIAQQQGIPVHTDAVQTFGKIETDVSTLGCEFVSLTAHKINGPKGVGAFYWRGKTPFKPLVFGGDQEQKLRAGTEGVHQLAGLGLAAELGFTRKDSEFSRLRRLRRRLIRGIRHIFPSAIIHEAAEQWQMPGTVNVAFPGKSGVRILAGLDCYEIGVSIGSACTADRIEPSHVLLGMGVSVDEALSTIRISMGTTTSALAVCYLIHVLRQVLEHDPPGFAYLDPQHLDQKRILAKQTVIIDLRFPHERMIDASIPGALLWSPFAYDFRLGSISNDCEVIFMCGTGIISTGAAFRLARRGHPRSRAVFGGYAAWKSLYPELIQQLSV